MNTLFQIEAHLDGIRAERSDLRRLQTRPGDRGRRRRWRRRRWRPALALRLARVARRIDDRSAWRAFAP